MIHVVCWLWHGTDRRRQYTARHVNRFADQVRRHTSAPHQVVCITDETDGIDERIRCVPMPAVVKGWTNHFRKLWLFSAEAGDLIGERMFFSDIDVCVTGCLDPLLTRSEDVVMWHDADYPVMRYSTGNYLLTAGARTAVWDQFDIERSPADIETHYRRTGTRRVGSDMAWISWRMRDEALYTRDDGIRRSRYLGPTLPEGVRIVHFSGADKPWTDAARRKYPWMNLIAA